MTDTDMSLVSAGAAALMLKVSAKTVVRMAQQGILPVAEITEGGHRRFRKSDVERLRQERAA